MKSLASRRARIARVNAKRPCVAIDVKRSPEPDARALLLDVLFDLLEPIVNSGRE